MPSEDPMRQMVCPSHAELVALREGTLPPERVSAIVLHLSNCGKCEAAYELVNEENELAPETLPALLKEAGPNSHRDQPDSTQRRVATKTDHSATPRVWDAAAPSSLPGRPEPAPDAPTRLGPYEVKERIGSGGMGTVYRAFHVKLKKWVALKVVRSDLLGDSQAVGRFQREMEAVGRLDHPNIVRATDAGEEGGIHFLVMEWVDGTDLANLVRDCGPLPLAEACELARQAAVALQCAHLQGLVHRDVKPSNLLLSQQGILKLLDLGLARLVGEREDSGGLTMLGQMMGTADYTAPEQWEASHTVDIRADLYSLGCTLYTLLAGKPPFSGPEFDTSGKKMAAHLQTPPPAIRRLRPEMPEALAKVLARLLAKKPAERYPSPAEAALALEPFAAGADLNNLAVRLTPSSSLDTQNALSAQMVTQPFKPDAARRSRLYRWRLWLVAGAAILLGISIVVLLVGKWLLAKPGIPESGRRGDPSASFEPGVSYELLERKPQAVLWPEEPGTSTWGFEDNKRILRITCTDMGMIQLANVHGERFDLEVKFSQTPWAGGVGVFFRGRDEGAGRDAHWCTDIVFLDYFTANGNPKTPLHRGIFMNWPSTKQAFPQWGKSEFVDFPKDRESRLKITVGPNGLEKVFWNGQATDPAFCEPPKSIPPRTGADGSVGVFVQHSHAAILSARLFLHPSPGNEP